MPDPKEQKDIRRALERLQLALIEANVMLRGLVGLPVRVEVTERDCGLTGGTYPQIVVGWLHDESGGEGDLPEGAAPGGGDEPGGAQ